MPLGIEEKRQITQFLLIAEHYLNLAKDSVDLHQTMGECKSSFLDPNRISSADLDLAILGAHLSSAAIRLASIEDVLADAGEGDPSFLSCRSYFNGSTSMNNNDHRASSCSEWLHVMLRDNAGHAEPPTASQRLRDMRRCERQRFILTLSLSEANSRLCEIYASVRDRLVQHHGHSVTVIAS